MFIRPVTPILSLSVLTSCAQVQLAFNKTIYDDDQRVFAEQAPLLIKPFLPTIAMLTKKQNVIEQTPDTSKLRPRTLGEVLRLCSSDMFYDQLMLGDCSGFAIDERHLVTARHCVADQKSCDERLFVFNSSKTTGAVFANADLRTCNRIVSALEREQGDLVLIELDSPITLPEGARFPKLSDSNGAEQSTGRAFVLGHPFGSVLTVTPLESPQKIQDPFFARARADVSQGSSGSPLIQESTGEIQGVLTGGEYDLVWEPEQGCNQNRTCAGDECQGERFSRTESLRQLIKSL